MDMSTCACHVSKARALERAGGVPAELRDSEYMHNVMYKLLTLTLTLTRMYDANPNVVP